MWPCAADTAIWNCFKKIPTAALLFAKSRAVIWANLWPRFEAYFRQATGQVFTTGIKVMVRVSVSYHAVFGLTLTVSSVNPEYTMGDLMKRRKEILQRLEKEGILELNRQLAWPNRFSGSRSYQPRERPVTATSSIS